MQFLLCAEDSSLSIASTLAAALKFFKIESKQPYFLVYNKRRVEPSDSLIQVINRYKDPSVIQCFFIILTDKIFQSPNIMTLKGSDTKDVNQHQHQPLVPTADEIRWDNFDKDTGYPLSGSKLDIPSPLFAWPYFTLLGYFQEHMIPYLRLIINTPKVFDQSGDDHHTHRVWESYWLPRWFSTIKEVQEAYDYNNIRTHFQDHMFEKLTEWMKFKTLDDEKLTTWMKTKTYSDIDHQHQFEFVTLMSMKFNWRQQCSMCLCESLPDRSVVNQNTAMFVPCGHAVCLTTCYWPWYVKNKYQNQCPMCQTKVTKMIIPEHVKIDQACLDHIDLTKWVCNVMTS